MIEPHSKMDKLPNTCCINNNLDDKCFFKMFDANQTLRKFSSLSKDDLQILYLRLPQLKNSENNYICDKHYQKYVIKYSNYEKACCDPFSKHSSIISKRLLTIHLNKSVEAKKLLNISIIPGKKLCSNCNIDLNKRLAKFHEETQCCIDPFKKHQWKVMNQLINLSHSIINYLNEVYDMKFCSEHKICSACNIELTSDISNYEKSLKNSIVPKNLLTETDDINTASSTPEIRSSYSSSDFQSGSQNKRKLDTVLDVIGVPPFKRNKLNNDYTAKEGCKIIQQVVNKVSEVFEDAYEVNLPKFENIQQISSESNWFRNMISNFQIIYNDTLTTFDQKIFLLTLLPEEWPFRQINEYFQCNRYMFHEIRKLRNNIGKKNLLH